MSLRSTLIAVLVVASACAGCAGSPTAGVYGTGEGQAAPGADARQIPSCGGGTSYNRASGLCIGPGGP